MTRFYVCLVALIAPAMARPASFQVIGTDAKPWAQILGAFSFTRTAGRDAAIVVAGSNAPLTVAAQAENRILILEGSGELAGSFGIKPGAARVSVRQICDEHAPQMQIFWEKPTEVTGVELPTGFQVFAKERWKGTPLLAGKRTGHGAILWLAASPGLTGIERFPYLPQALADLGAQPACAKHDPMGLLR